MLWNGFDLVLLKWPGQVVIAGCQTYWSSEVSQELDGVVCASGVARKFGTAGQMWVEVFLLVHACTHVDL